MSSTTAEEPRSGRGFGWPLWLALAAAWFATVPLRPLFDPDEGRYAEIPREMLVSGDWVTPRLDGLKYFEKPPLQYWATAVAYAAFGQSEWTARLWTVGLAFLCLPMVFAWTARLYGVGSGMTALTALAVSPYFAVIGHLNLLDAGFSFFLAGAVFAFLLAQHASEGSPGERAWMLTAWLAAALAVLSKGIVVPVLTGGSLVIYSVLERDARVWRRLHPLPGAALFLLVAAPWFIAVSVRNPSFPGFFFLHEHFARFLTTVHGRVEPWWYFGPLLLLATLPWLPGLRGVRIADSTADNRFNSLKFLVIFSALTVLFFSASGSKLAPYVLPAIPPLAAVVGARNPLTVPFARSCARVGAALTAVLALGLVIYTERHFGVLPGAGILWLMLALAAAAGGILVTWKVTGQRTTPVIWGTAASAVLIWQCLTCAVAEFPPPRSSFHMLQNVMPLVGPDTELYSVGQYRETISPYLHRTMPLVEFKGELGFGLAEEPAQELSPQVFLSRWNAAAGAIAFLEPDRLDAWRQRGLRGRIVAQDADTVAVARP